MHPWRMMSSTSHASAPWQTLKSALALTTTGAIYDGNTGVTQSSGVTAWTDALGNAPTLNKQGSGTNPSYNAGTGAITITAGQNVLETATATALFDTSVAVSLAVICSVATAPGGDQNLCAMNEGGGGYSRMLGIQEGNHYNPYYPGETLAGTVVPSSTIRLVIVSFGAGAINIDVPNQTRQTTSVSAVSAGNNYLTLGGYYIETAELTATFYAVVVIPRVVTVGDITALKAYATARGYTAA
jgi:hypothetical protein